MKELSKKEIEIVSGGADFSDVTSTVTVNMTPTEDALDRWISTAPSTGL